MKMRNPFRGFRHWNTEIKFKPQDCWIGIQWMQAGDCFDVFICLLPMISIHVSWWKPREPAIPRTPAIPSITSAEIISAITVESAKVETIVAIEPQSKWVDTRPTNSGSRFF
jgi:hypothetical protein